MNIKKNHLLKMAIMSLLGMSQSAEAVLYAPTTLPDGAGGFVSRVIEYTDEAQQNLFATDLGLGVSLLNQLVPNATTAIGMVTGSNVNGSLVSIINISSGKVAIAQPQPNGTTTFVTVAGGTNTNGGKISALAMAQEYLKVTSSSGYTPNPKYAVALPTAVSIGATPDTITLINASLAGLASAVQKEAKRISSVDTTAHTATFDVLTDPKAIIESQVSTQSFSSTLNAAVATTPSSLTLASTATGAIVSVTQSAVVKLAAAKTNAVSSQSVTAAILSGTTVIPGVNPAVARASAAEINTASSIGLLSALTAPSLATEAANVGVTLPTVADLAIATASVANATLSLQQQTTALSAALPATDPAVIAAQAQLIALASQSATVQVVAATAIATVPGATLTQITDAAAAIATANATLTAAGGALTPAQIQAAADAQAALNTAQNTIVNALSGPAQTAAQALINQTTVVNANAVAIVNAQTKAAALNAAKTAFDAALTGTDLGQKAATLAAYQSAATASQAAAAAGKTAADAIVTAKLVYRDAQAAYVTALTTAGDPNLAAEQAKLDTANTDLATAQADAATAATVVTDASAALATIATNTTAGGIWAFPSGATIAAQAAVATAQTAVTAANTAYTNAVAALTPAQKADLAALQAGTLTGAAKAAAQKSLASLVPLVQAQVTAQTALIAKQITFVAALKADPNGAAALATAQSDLTAMTTALAGLKTVIAAIVPIDAAVVAAAAKVETDKVRSVFAAADVAGVLDAETRLNAAAQAGDAALAAVEAQNLAGELAKIKTTQFQARNNSTSGIAGNPASNMNMTIDGAFNQVADFGGTSEASKANVSGASADIGGVSTSVGVGLQYGYYDIGGKSVNTVTMPLSVTAKFNPKHQLTLSVPLSYIQTQSQADAYQVGVTAAYKYNVSDNWSLTPSASYSYRSFDNSQNQYWNPNTSTSLVGGSITSKYTWNFNDVGVSLINMIGHYQTLDSEKNATANVNITGLGNFVGSSVSNNGIASYVVKNGLHATKMFGSFKLGAYFTDTEYFGTDLYFNQLNEFGFSLKPVNAGKMLDALSIDANYLFSIGGKHSSELDGFRLNLGYKF